MLITVILKKTNRFFIIPAEWFTVSSVIFLKAGLKAPAGLSSEEGKVCLGNVR